MRCCGRRNVCLNSRRRIRNATWSNDNAGFYYQRFAEPRSSDQLTGVNEYAKLYYHHLGKPQSTDKLIYERPDHKDWNFAGQSTEDGRYLVMEISKGAEDKNIFFYQDLKTRVAKVVELVSVFEGAYNFLGNEGSRFYFRTTAASPKGRILMIDVTKPARQDWKVIVPEQKDTLQDARMAGGMLTLAYLKDAYSAAKIYKLDGSFVRDVALPGIGTVTWSSARLSDTELFYSYTSFSIPSAIYHYDLKTGATTVTRESKLGFDPAVYETRQVFYNSKDGTRVPMFLVYKKGLTQNGANPTYLYGYGGFNISLTPSFSVPIIEWMERGGLFAVPNLRGGGEYGEARHRARIPQRYSMMAFATGERDTATLRCRPASAQRLGEIVPSRAAAIVVEAGIVGRGIVVGRAIVGVGGCIVGSRRSVGVIRRCIVKILVIALRSVGLIVIVVDDCLATGRSPEKAASANTP